MALKHFNLTLYTLWRHQADVNSNNGVVITFFTSNACLHIQLGILLDSWPPARNNEVYQCRGTNLEHNVSLRLAGKYGTHLATTGTHW